MAESDVKVLGSWASPFVLRARIALHLKSVNYEYIEENLLESTSELLLKSNPVFKKVPVLIHGDKPICESLIIVQYIDEVWSSAPSILPSDPHERATARFWAAYLDEKVYTFVICSHKIIFHSFFLYAFSGGKVLVSFVCSGSLP